MENKNPMELRKKIESKLIEKAWKETEFREELINNTREVVERESGIRLPGNIKITVVEESEKEVYLALPLDPAKMGDLLTDEELDALAGGPAGQPFPCPPISEW